MADEDGGRGRVVPIGSNSLGSLGELEVLHAYCRRCKRAERLDRSAPVFRGSHGCNSKAQDEGGGRMAGVAR